MINLVVYDLTVGSSQGFGEYGIWGMGFDLNEIDIHLPEDGECNPEV